MELVYPINTFNTLITAFSYSEKMTPYISYLNNTVNKNNNLIEHYKAPVNWINNGSIYSLETERNDLFEYLKNNINHSYKKSKPWYKSLSKGCQICAEGKWSCLFINNICNATCEFCPTQQDNDEIPATQGCSFNTPEEFADYINFFKFKGVSISGGEPLKTFEKTVNYIKAVRKYCDKDIYVWLYTNGILGTPEIFKTLNEIGVDEVRFNLGASNYNINLIKNAKPYIKNITVEIPAIPEDYDKLTTLLPQLIEEGVTNLNLHQLRLTPYNISKLASKPYTFTHGAPPTVVESEITALKVLKFVSENQLLIGVNYCNYHYKNNFQKAGFRKHISSKFINNHSEITELGFIRTIKTDEENNVDLETLELNPEINNNIRVSYSYYSLSDSNDFKGDAETITINSKEYYLKTKNTVSNIETTTNLLIENLQHKTCRDISDESLFKIFQKEIIEDEFPEYF